MCSIEVQFKEGLTVDYPNMLNIDLVSNIYSINSVAFKNNFTFLKFMVFLNFRVKNTD